MDLLATNSHCWLAELMLLPVLLSYSFGFPDMIVDQPLSVCRAEGFVDFRDGRCIQWLY